MSPPFQEPLFDLSAVTHLTVRRRNVLRSPKQYGSADEDARPYLDEMGLELLPVPQPIQFQPNTSEVVHRWSPYVQGFSASFVQRTIERYKDEYRSPVVLDPFAGSGTVLVQAKMNGLASWGVELNPLLHFVSQVKVSSWHVSAERFLRIAEQVLVSQKFAEPPEFLKSESHFRPAVLFHLRRLKGGIDSLQPTDEEEAQIRNLLLLAFAAILVDSSNLKRAPCLGYAPTKVVDDNAPLRLFSNKVHQIAEDLLLCQNRYTSYLDTPARVLWGNSMHVRPNEFCDLMITSPPYMNGMDYVMNYKIEMGWLGFGKSHRELKKIKDQMVVCDNVSKSLIHSFEQVERYTHPWIEDIKEHIAHNIRRRGNYRRHDMPSIVHKYFDDMYRVMRNTVEILRPGGRIVMVVGDSLIADVYVPTDLILARIGEDLGLKIERLEKARERRSGQVRSYRLRETIVTLRKPETE